MTATNHAVFGAIIGVVVPHPAIAIPLAFASHFVLDSLPHGGIKDHRKMTPFLLFDISLALIFLSILVIIQPAHFVLLSVCAVAGMSPDLMWFPGYIRMLRRQKKKSFNAVQKFHASIQRFELPWGYYIELPWLVTMIYALVSLER